MKNNAKQIIENAVLKGRKVFWFGEETEIFVAKSVEQLVEEYGLQDEDETLEEQSGQLPISYLWRIRLLDELDGTCHNAINYVYGDKDTVVQLTTSYN